MEASLNRILAIAWSMPPMLFPRALQISRTLRELNRRGWKSTVITVNPSGNRSGNTDTRDDRVLADRYRDAYRRITVEAREEVDRSGLLVRLRRRVRPVDDVTMDNWERRACRLATQIMKKKQNDVLVTFAQPWSDHRVGLKLRRRFPSLPWVAHFSDPWVDNPYHGDLLPTKLDAWRQQESDVVHLADRLVFVSERTAALVMAKYHPELQTKVHVVPHAFDRELLDAALSSGGNTSREGRRPFQIIYTGNLYAGMREPRALLEALSDLVAETPLSGRLEVFFIGHQPADFRNFAAMLGLDGIIRFRGPVGYLESLRLAAEADALLLVDAPSPNSVFLPSKLIDYLMLEKPIIGLTPPEGESADVLRLLGYPIVAPDDRAEIGRLLKSLLEPSGDNLLKVNESHRAVAARYDVQNTTTDFEQVLLAAVSDTHRPIPRVLTPSRSKVPPAVERTETDGQPSISRTAEVAKVDPDADQFRLAVERLVRGFEPVSVAVQKSLPPHVAEILLGSNSISSVILPVANVGLSDKYPDRVGWFDQLNSTWHLPNRLSRVLLFLGEPNDLGVRMVTAALRCGVRRFGFYTFLPGGLALRRVEPVLAGCVARAAEWRLWRRLVPTGDDRYINGPAQKNNWAERCLEGLCRNRVSRLLGCTDSIRPERDADSRQRILLVTNSLGPGGAERQLTYTVRALLDAGIRDIVVLCNSLDGETNAFHFASLQKMGVRVWTIDPLASLSSDNAENRYFAPFSELTQRLVSASPALALQVLPYFSAFVSWRPTVVHTWQDSINVHAGLAALLAGVPRIVLSCRSFCPAHFLFHRPIMRPAYRSMLANPHVEMLNNSAAGAQDYADWLGITPDRIHVVRNAFDPSELPEATAHDRQRYRQRLGLPECAPVVGGILRFSEEKRPKLWIQAAAELAARRPDVHFLMIGDGPLFENIRSSTEALGLDGRVCFPGYERDTAAAIGSMDLLLLTSRLEGLPNVLIEAQSMGIPVISTDVGGVREAMDEGVTGSAVRTDSPVELAERMAEILSDETWRNHVSEVGPAFVRNRFSLKRMGYETISAYGIDVPCEAN